MIENSFYVNDFSLVTPVKAITVVLSCLSTPHLTSHDVIAEKPCRNVCNAHIFFFSYIPGKWTGEQPSHISLKSIGIHLTMNGRVC